jgi:hypothetical protein
MLYEPAGTENPSVRSILTLFRPLRPDPLNARLNHACTDPLTNPTLYALSVLLFKFSSLPSSLPSVRFRGPQMSGRRAENVALTNKAFPVQPPGSAM